MVETPGTRRGNIQIGRQLPKLSSAAKNFFTPLGPSACRHHCGKARPPRWAGSRLSRRTYDPRCRVHRRNDRVGAREIASCGYRNGPKCTQIAARNGLSGSDGRCARHSRSCDSHFVSFLCHCHGDLRGRNRSHRRSHEKSQAVNARDGTGIHRRSDTLRNRRRHIRVGAAALRRNFRRRGGRRNGAQSGYDGFTVCGFICDPSQFRGSDFGIGGFCRAYGVGDDSGHIILSGSLRRRAHGRGGRGRTHGGKRRLERSRAPSIVLGGCSSNQDKCQRSADNRCDRGKTAHRIWVYGPL